MVFDEKKYQYRNGRSFPVPAQVAGEELEKLGINERPVAPSEVVEAARPKDSPLHCVFEWNVRKAARLHNESQAREFLRSIVQVSVVSKTDEGDDEEEEQQIAFVSVGTKGPKGQAGYISVNTAMSDGTMRDRVLADATAQLRGWRMRYGHLKELSTIVEAIDETMLAPLPA